MSGVDVERDPILPQGADIESWTPKEKMAFAWVIDRVAAESLSEVLEDLALDIDAEERIRAVAGVGRASFMGYIGEVTGENLADEEFDQVMWEIGRAEQEISEHYTKLVEDANE